MVDPCLLNVTGEHLCFGEPGCRLPISVEDTVVVGLSIESILDVALTHDVEVTDALNIYLLHP